MTNISTLNDVQKIIVLDYGSQYNQLIARRIREFGVFSELKSHKITADEVRAINPIGIILSGGPNSVYAEDAFGIDEEIFELGIPILGICYGMQLLTHKLGGKVVPAGEAGNREYGQSTLRLRAQSELFAGTPEEQVVLMSHGDAVTEIPEGFHLVADSVDCPFAAMEDTKKNFYGIQFHPEVRHTVYGNDILKNFAFSICGAKGDWSMANFVDMQIAQIRETVGDRKVLLGLSGGVDSSVVGVLLQKAIGDQLTCIFVDHGLLRKGEGDQVMEMLGGKFGLNIIRVDASKRFLDLLAGVDDPEQKRKIIGNEFVHVFDDEASKLKGVDFLAQGTLYTDIIESGTETAQTIKSHHNVGGLPEDMQFELIEPLNTLFKDEVRALGTELGMPDEVVWRQPFPGPGLAIRIMGEITEEKLETVRESDAILREEIAKAGLDRDVWQYFTVNTGVRSVGVMGDGRTYDYTIAIRAITSIDGMTADFAKLPWEVLQKISVRIVNEVEHVNRIVYDITSKPPATVEWE
ncbi:glutamine-hydrolyzing GMP synthase [Streptococcus thermophilus]|uniref:glutamine-hydrolyzing GMP synthase n=1 Tax=Streptococcus thermophilus TaxID=1308 RepID=UPI0022F10486|nr:glutamine-hydrolyzing GMP synthase [Streptococcus thermophilus]MCE2080894.1 glutamine-hydrolyzing GMP synthase [Streptococcus thermophilus]MCE2089175.1 glutamine-hydrolyzing GMP synthase [Streptococcus thermophilus]MCE2151472.1 glutamine-hydrolyzing GMP synthase [Streptococcus thermophilus]MCE2226758.1 glutamine-hydrolyzing GMP synthase [Streptococcus thermophilus]MCE2229846.1 glutamine-hydrolyzing GMP synthase [Streptococcus thermophilus]